MTVKSFPDLPLIMAVSKLEDLLLSYVKEDTILGLSIRVVLSQKKKNYMGKIVVALTGAYQYNKQATIGVIGDEAMELVKEISSKLKPQYQCK